nr:hypothetical protein [Tanacetum cinerariifolium]
RNWTFSTIKVVSRHQTTQQYGAILPIKLTTDEIRNSKAYKEYYACASGEAAPKPKASARKKKRSKQETHISQQRGSGTDEGTDVGGHEEGDKSDESDDERDEGSDDDSNETVKAAPKPKASARKMKGDFASSTTPPTPTLTTTVVSAPRISATAKESHVTLTPVNPDGPQESSSMSSFVTSMLNLTSDVGVESIFTTASSPIVSLQTTTPIMTPSTIATIIPSIILENLPTFNSAFRFDERLRLLETSFFEYRQTNPFVDAVSAILGIVQ